MHPCFGFKWIALCILMVLLSIHFSKGIDDIKLNSQPNLFSHQQLENVGHIYEENLLKFNRRKMDESQLPVI